MVNILIHKLTLQYNSSLFSKIGKRKRLACFIKTTKRHEIGRNNYVDNNSKSDFGKIKIGM